MITGAIKSLLLTNQSIRDIVDDRIRVYSIGPKETLPAMDIRAVASLPTEQSLLGNKPGFSTVITIDCYSDNSHAQADTLASLLFSQAILGYRGTIGSVVIRGIVADGGPDQDSETVDPGSEKRRYVTSVDFNVSWAIL
jgi:hypothetical protein